jgi:hypothetical protein
VLPDGSPAEIPKARIPKDWAVYSHLTGWRLEGEERLKIIEKREKQYEEHGTTERARPAVAAAALSSSSLTGSLAAQGQGKDRVQILQSAVEPYYEKDSSRGLQRENACLEITENARRAALDKIAPSLAYLAGVGYNGVAQLNRWIKVSTTQQIRPGANEDQTEMQDLDDFEPPEAFHEIINTIHFMSLEEARTALKYEGLYNFLQRPRVLRIQLRRIASKLGRVQLPDPSWDKLAAQEQRLEIRKYLMKTLPTIRSAYADMTAFADNVNEYISTICKEQDQIPEQLLKRYQLADDQHKTELAKELFAQGMSMEDRRMLDETHFTKHFTILRSLINLKSQQEICQRLGSFGQGLQEMREKLEFKELVIDEDEEMTG